MNKNQCEFTLGKLDVVDLYGWYKDEKLIYKTYFQRQSVWRDKDREDLIDTILLGYPMPAVFICDAETDYDNMTKKYNVLDGRQRLESIFKFIDNGYCYKGRKFSELEDSQKKKILNFNVALVQMYIDSTDTEKIKDIFKRLNKSSYTLNKIEKLSTQMVEYDYMIIAKILVGIVEYKNAKNYIEEINQLFYDSEDDLNHDSCEVESYDIKEDDNFDSFPQNIKNIVDNCEFDVIIEMFNSDSVFTHYDISRQLNLQYFLNIFTCIIKNEMIHRNVNEKIINDISNDIDSYSLSGVITRFNSVCKIIKVLYGKINNKFWKNKACFFTICYSLFNNITENDLVNINNELIESTVFKLDNFFDNGTDDWNSFYDYAKQGVNDKDSRMIRNNIFNKIVFD